VNDATTATDAYPAVYTIGKAGIGLPFEPGSRCASGRAKLNSAKGSIGLSQQQAMCLPQNGKQAQK
jgi:hypothetical protein